MSKVSPGPGKYDDLADTEQDQKALRDFEQHTLEETDNEEKGPQNEGTPAKTKSTVGQSWIGCLPPNRIGSPGRQFIQCDILVGLILIGYALCIVCTALAIYYYRKDTQWNNIVNGERSFPILKTSEFFSDKRLLLYENNEAMRNAKKALLREDRWLEILHMVFLGSFLVLTVFQVAAYITRGEMEDHCKLIAIYYLLYGSLGAVVGLFPLLSYQQQQRDYLYAIVHLQRFSTEVGRLPVRQWGNGRTNGTAQDAMNLAGIMKFCYEVSVDGLYIDDDKRFYRLYGRKYHFHDLKYLGFCTQHDFKIINTILSLVFAIVCWIIPCVYYFVVANVFQYGLCGRPRPGQDVEQDAQQSLQPVEETQERRHHKRSKRLSVEEKMELEKFKKFVEADRQKENAAKS